MSVMKYLFFISTLLFCSGAHAESLQERINKLPRIGGVVVLNDTFVAKWPIYIPNDNVTISGTGTIQSSHNDNVVVVTGANVKIEGITVTAPNSSAGNGILVATAEKFSADGVTIKNVPGSGILTQNVDQVRITNSSIANVGGHCIVTSIVNDFFAYGNNVSGCGHAGILTYTARSYVVSHNTVNGTGNNFAGVRCAVECGSGVISHNIVKNADRGVHLVSQSRHTVVSSNIFDNIKHAGMLVEDALYFRASDNIFTRTSWAKQEVADIYLVRVMFPQVNNNIFTANATKRVS